jgi:hypothetical protein
MISAFGLGLILIVFGLNQQTFLKNKVVHRTR